jgi:hypothetical protein
LIPSSFPVVSKEKGWHKTVHREAVTTMGHSGLPVSRDKDEVVGEKSDIFLS